MLDIDSPGPTLKLDLRNRKLVTRLELKLEEYRKRADPYMAPELMAATSNFYKALVLEKLLRDGKVETWAFHRELVARFPFPLDSHRYDNACAVINDYITGRPEYLSGGTGLPEVQK